MLLSVLPVDMTQHPWRYSYSGILRIVSPVNMTQHPWRYGYSGILRIVSPVKMTQHPWRYSSSGMLRIVSPVYMTQHPLKIVLQGCYVMFTSTTQHPWTLNFNKVQVTLNFHKVQVQKFESVWNPAWGVGRMDSLLFVAIDTFISGLGALYGHVIFYMLLVRCTGGRVCISCKLRTLPCRPQQ